MVRDAGRYVVVGQYTDAGDVRSTRTATSTAGTPPCSAAGATSSRTSTARSR